MKTLALTIAAAVGFAGLTQDASAAKRRVSVRIGGGGIAINVGKGPGIVIGNHAGHGHSKHPGHGHGNHPGHGHPGPGGFQPGIGNPVGPIVGPPVFVKPYLVKYHMHGTQSIRVNSYYQARRTARYLENLGLHADVRGGFGTYFVTYHMHGTKVRTFYDHLSAHEFEQQLERLSVHAQVIH